MSCRRPCEKTEEIGLWELTIGGAKTHGANIKGEKKIGRREKNGIESEHGAANMCNLELCFLLAFGVPVHVLEGAKMVTDRRSEEVL